MKFIKWKILIITSLVCLLPILPGVVFLNKLPENIAIHFNFYGEPDGYASRGFAVFALPLIMALFQLICCFSSDINVKKHGETKNIEAVIKWLLPCLSVVLQAVTLGYALGININISKIIPFIVGVILIVTGGCVAKLDYLKNCDIPPEKAKKINRYTGFGAMITGLIFILFAIIAVSIKF